MDNKCLKNEEKTFSSSYLPRSSNSKRRAGKPHKHDQKTGLLDQLIFDAFCVDESKQFFIKEDLEAANIYNII